jgi:membrane-bound serine protease (ClpP class)
LTKYEPGLKFKLLSWLLHPQVAYLLLMGGIAGLFFELSHPGVLFPGIFGGICLLLSLYALAVLPTNVAGVLLLLLGVILFVLEIAVVSYGMLSVAAVVSIFLGSLMLFDFEYGFQGLTVRFILPSVLTLSALISLAIYLLTKAQLKPRQNGLEAMIGLIGTVISWQDNQGKIKVRGEIWNAVSTGNEVFKIDDTVKIEGVKGLVLKVAQTSKLKD